MSVALDLDGEVAGLSNSYQIVETVTGGYRVWRRQSALRGSYIGDECEEFADALALLLEYIREDD